MEHLVSTLCCPQPLFVWHLDQNILTICFWEGDLQNLINKICIENGR
uniref:Uncharacterized protein n=1 Tax=Arundo donax TaxID=35708 RepID=A0A0A8ZRD8_ARUDO